MFEIGDKVQHILNPVAGTIVDTWDDGDRQVCQILVDGGAIRYFSHFYAHEIELHQDKTLVKEIKVIQKWLTK
jgi:hypothetical protein